MVVAARAKAAAGSAAARKRGISGRRVQKLRSELGHSGKHKQELKIFHWIQKVLRKDMGQVWAVQDLLNGDTSATSKRMEKPFNRNIYRIVGTNNKNGLPGYFHVTAAAACWRIVEATMNKLELNADVQKCLIMALQEEDDGEVQRDQKPSDLLEGMIEVSEEMLPLLEFLAPRLKNAVRIDWTSQVGFFLLVALEEEDVFNAVRHMRTGVTKPLEAEFHCASIDLNKKVWIEKNHIERSALLMAKRSARPIMLALMFEKEIEASGKVFLLTVVV